MSWCLLFFGFSRRFDVKGLHHSFVYFDDNDDDDENDDDGDGDSDDVPDVFKREECLNRAMDDERRRWVWWFDALSGQGNFPLFSVGSDASFFLERTCAVDLYWIVDGGMDGFVDQYNNTCSSNNWACSGILKRCRWHSFFFSLISGLAQLRPLLASFLVLDSHSLYKRLKRVSLPMSMRKLLDRSGNGKEDVWT